MRKKYLKNCAILCLGVMLISSMAGCKNDEQTATNNTGNALETEENTMTENDTVTIEEAETVEAEEETTEENPEEEQTEEVTYITDYTSISDYMGSLDPQQPAIVIYNEAEGYIINMQNEQEYELKAGDKILLNTIDIVGKGFNEELLAGRLEVMDNYIKVWSDYSTWEEKQKTSFSMYPKDEEPVRIICYLTPPTE